MLLPTPPRASKRYGRSGWTWPSKRRGFTHTLISRNFGLVARIKPPKPLRFHIALVDVVSRSSCPWDVPKFLVLNGSGSCRRRARTLKVVTFSAAILTDSHAQGCGVFCFGNRGNKPDH